MHLKCKYSNGVRYYISLTYTIIHLKNTHREILTFQKGKIITVSNTSGPINFAQYACRLTFAKTVRVTNTHTS